MGNIIHWQSCIPFFPNEAVAPGRTNLAVCPSDSKLAQKIQHFLNKKNHLRCMDIGPVHASHKSLIPQSQDQTYRGTGHWALSQR